MGLEVRIVLHVLSIVYLMQCAYPPMGNEVMPGSVLLPATRRGRYLANVVQRQAVDGTEIKFNKDADRMNAEARKKVDVLSEELLPYIIAEQERRITLHKRVMTAIQNGEKGITVVEMRNKPPLIIRKGLMYRCPANRAPKEPDGSGDLACEDDITPTQIIYDSCLSAEDKELYNAENKYFFCNRHKLEGPDLPRNGTTVYGCAPIERTSYNYTTSKCALEDTEDVVVHYRYYPDRSYKYVAELDPDREVCDHWNPCQIGYIFALASADTATPASELWQDNLQEFVHPGAQGYTSSPRTINIPHHGRRTGFSLDAIQVKNSKGRTRKISASHYSVKFGLFSLTITLSFDVVSSWIFGSFFAVVVVDNKPTSMKFLDLVESNVEVDSHTVDCLQGQKLNGSSIAVKCDRCRVNGLMVRSRDNNMYDVPSNYFRVKTQLVIEVNIRDPQPQVFGDYFALIENNRGQEERHKVLTVRENVIHLKRFNASYDERGNYNNMTDYECKDCELTDILCNGQSVQSTGRVTIIPQSKQISYNFPSFDDQFSCVYMGLFKIKDTAYKKIVAVIQNNLVHIPNVVKVTAPKEDDTLEEDIVFKCSEDCEVREVTVNGINLEQSARRSGIGDQAIFQVIGNSISIHIGPFLESYAGVYQAKFHVENEIITKNIMEVIQDDGSSTRSGKILINGVDIHDEDGHVFKNYSGYGTEWIFFPDGNGVPHFVNLTMPTVLQTLKWNVKEKYRLYSRGISNFINLDQTAKADDDAMIRKLLSNKPVKVVTHGWMSSAEDSVIMDIKDSYMKSRDVVVIAVDWSGTAKDYLYPIVASKTEAVGSLVGEFLNKFCKLYDVSGDRIHLIGHSLGAHVMGIAAPASKMSIARITGLDPARPLFEHPKKPNSLSLDSSDAKFVDVIHSCSGILGVEGPIGHADFYPNSGEPPQPGCNKIFTLMESCSHGRSYIYFAESIVNLNGFPACRNINWKEYLKSNECKDSTFMGENVNRNAKGQYYLKTNAKKPYARNN